MTVLLLLSLATSAASAQGNETMNLIEVAGEEGNFTTLLEALDAANLTDNLEETGPFTVFAPTDDAFAALPEGTLDALLNNTTALREVLLYHVTDERLAAEDVVNLTNITTLQGEDIPVNVTDEGVFVGDAEIIMTDINASNGVIHAIDAVLIPPAPADNQTGGNQTGGNQTGGNQTGGNLTDIIETADQDGNFTTLLTALNATNLTNTLKGTGPFTVFAPTDDAFDALPEGTLDALLNNTTELRRVLLYHVASGRLTSEDVANLTNITTLQGSRLPVNVTEDGVFVGDAEIILTDINASNGVIHAIDAVLIPPAPAGNQTGGNQTGGNQTGGNQTGGNQTGGNQTGGNQTGGTVPERWYFFSMPFEANNTSADYLLAGVNYTSLLYYNPSTQAFENVSNIEPLKGYWISVPGGTQFNASRQFASVERKNLTAPPSLQIYPGWNALGSSVNQVVPAEAAFITIDDLYSKVVGPWVPGTNNTAGSYQNIGYNGINGTVSRNQLGTDEFEVRPFEGYWVFVKQNNTYA